MKRVYDREYMMDHVAVVCAKCGEILGVGVIFHEHKVFCDDCFPKKKERFPRWLWYFMLYLLVLLTVAMALSRGWSL